jgi:tetratricopeptide (TPR) repeat protein
VLRLTAVLLGLMPFVAFEGLCMFCGWGRPVVHHDPFAGFRSTRPLFVLNADKTRYEIPRSRQWHFRAESFATQKAPDEFRIFCLGGSTVQGEPFELATSFTTWMEIALGAADPSRRWEVVNCGGVSYATYRLVPILDEVLRYSPDLIIFYEGHNEFLESREYAHVESRGRLVNGALAAASNLRTFTLARDAYLRCRGVNPNEPPRTRPILPTEVEALLDYRGGLEEYHRDESWRQDVITHFQFSLRQIVERAHEAGVPLILVNPVSNLADCPPFKSEHRADLTAAELSQWESLCEAARARLHAKNRDLLEAASLFEQACQLDPLYAGTFYNLGKCFEEAGEFEKARAAYLQAKELDVCPLRALEAINEIVLETARDTETPLVDARSLFEQRSRHGMVGRDWLVDHVHPSVEGHQLLSDALVDKLIELRYVDPQPGWEQAKRERYREHLDSLGNLYFVKAMDRLKSLQRWAQGRSRRLRGTPDGPSGSKAAQASASESDP